MFASLNRAPGPIWSDTTKSDLHLDSFAGGFNLPVHNELEKLPDIVVREPADFGDAL